MPWTLELDVQGTVQGWLAEAIGPLEAAFKETAPVGNGPGAGAGRDSIQGDPNGQGADFTALKHMLYQMTGTRPHAIHGKPWLVFEGNSGTVFLKEPNFVEHPGTQPNDYIERGIEAVFPGLATQLGNALLAQTIVTGGDA